MKYFALAMCAVYAAAGLALLFTNAVSDLIPRYRLPLGLLLLGYAIVRLVLWWRKNLQQKGEA